MAVDDDAEEYILVGVQDDGATDAVCLAGGCCGQVGCLGSGGDCDRDVFGTFTHFEVEGDPPLVGAHFSSSSLSSRFRLITLVVVALLCHRVSNEQTRDHLVLTAPGSPKQN